MPTRPVPAPGPVLDETSPTFTLPSPRSSAEDNAFPDGLFPLPNATSAPVPAVKRQRTTAQRSHVIQGFLLDLDGALTNLYSPSLTHVNLNPNASALTLSHSDALETPDEEHPDTPVRRRTAASEARHQADLDSGIAEVWERYKATHGQRDRDALLLHYRKLVTYVAGRVRNGLPHTIEQDDLVQYGFFGLVDAIEKFQPERGLKFETYALTRIRGAIIDELRTVDWVPRSVRSKIRVVQTAYVALEGLLNRTPTEDEVSERTGFTAFELRAISAQVSNTRVTALDDLLRGGGDSDDASVSLGDRLTDSRVQQPGDELELEESQRALAASIKDLPERDRTVISLYYFEGLTLAEIGTVLNLTESRVCQLHTKALEILKDVLGQTI